MASTFLAIAALLAADPRSAGHPHPTPAVGARAAYAFRPHVDDRSHGASAQLYADVPVWGPFAARAETWAGAWGGSPTTAQPIALGAGALQLVYVFDETDTAAIVGVGPFAAASVDGAQGFA